MKQELTCICIEKVVNATKEQTLSKLDALVRKL